MDCPDTAEWVVNMEEMSLWTRTNVKPDYEMGASCDLFLANADEVWLMSWVIEPKENP